MAQFVEKVFRSRQTLLSVLHDRGYDVVGAQKFGPEEIREALAVTSNGRGLEFTIKARDGMNVPTPTVRVYIFLQRIKQKLPGFLSSLETPVGISPESAIRKPDALGSPVDPAQTSVICLINEPVVSVFHLASINQWNTRNLRLSFFYMDSFQMNPLHHFLVPPHTIIPKEQHEPLMKSMYINQRVNFHLSDITKIRLLV